MPWHRLFTIQAGIEPQSSPGKMMADSGTTYPKLREPPEDTAGQAQVPVFRGGSSDIPGLAPMRGECL